MGGVVRGDQIGDDGVGFKECGICVGIVDCYRIRQYGKYTILDCIMILHAVASYLSDIETAFIPGTRPLGLTLS